MGVAWGVLVGIGMKMRMLNILVFGLLISLAGGCATMRSSCGSCGSCEKTVAGSSYGKSYALNSATMDLLSTNNDQQMSYYSRNDKQPYAYGSYSKPTAERVVEYNHQSTYTNGNRVYYQDRSYTTMRREYYRR
ncbi:hypothetical protein JD969_02460 [Planctomycetota bacterium]|nr:hypothetical protein JD969_02460 [Planctomycetota bacterium]